MIGDMIEDRIEDSLTGQRKIAASYDPFWPGDLYEISVTAIHSEFLVPCTVDGIMYYRFSQRMAIRNENLREVFHGTLLLSLGYRTIKHLFIEPPPGAGKEVMTYPQDKNVPIFLCEDFIGAYYGAHYNFRKVYDGRRRMFWITP